MSRKKVLIAISIILLVLAGFGLWLYLLFQGSLLKKLVMTKNAGQYVAMFYPDEDLEVDFATYDFKTGMYSCRVHAPSGGDLYFDVYRNSKGEMTDDFGIRVLQKENTILRLGIALNDYLDAFLAKNFPHRTSLVLCDASTEITDRIRDRLRISMPFSAADYPIPSEMTVWVETAGEEPTWEELAERLRELRAVTKEEFPFVTSYSMSIQEPYVEIDGGYAPADYSKGVSVYGVPADIIETPKLEAWLENERLRQEKENEALLRGEEIRKENPEEQK